MADDTSQAGRAAGAGDPNDRRTQIVSLVGRDRSVVLVGVGTGEVAGALVEAGCQVIAVDAEDAFDPTLRGRLKELVVADVRSQGLAALVDTSGVDVVVLDGVLQGTSSPEALLTDARSLLSPGGALVVSVPNAGHATLRLAALRTGATATTVHPFTGDSLCSLLERGGWVVDVYRATMADPLDLQATAGELRGLPAGVVEWVRHQPDALRLEYVVHARAAGSDHEEAGRAPLEVLAAADDVRRTDEFTAQRQAQQGESLAVLNERDHLLGLEARTVAAAIKQRQAEQRAQRLESRAKRLKGQLLDLAEAVDAMPRGRGQRRARALADLVRSGRGGHD